MQFKDLCDIDDLATSFIVDVFLGFQTQKMDIQFKEMYTCKKQLKSVIDSFVQNQSMEEAINTIWNSEYIPDHLFKEFIKKLVKYHIECYIGIFYLDSGFKIEPCYSLENKKGAKPNATKYWHKGDIVKCLVGYLADITEKDEYEMLHIGKNDFSIMYSCRKNSSQLYLSPAAYVNHDCQSNCIFMPMDKGCVAIQLVKDIRPGQEMTCFYGHSYFGNSNEQCECVSCEINKKGVFTQFGPYNLRTRK